MKKILLILFILNTFYLNSQCFKSVSAGSHHNLLIHTNGSLYAWGKDDNGAVGNPNSNLIINYPIQISTETDWKAVFTGSETSFAIKNDGTLWVWGEGSSGRLGLGTNNNTYTTTKLGTDTDWEYISASVNTIALKIDGSVWGWGSNSFGQLGVGDKTTRLSPVKISNENNWKSIVTLGSHTLAIKNDGTLWGTGKNNDGALGDGTRIDKIIFTQIGTENNWVQVTGGSEFSLGLKSDGTIWVWGRNYIPFTSANIFGSQYPSTILNPISYNNDSNWVQISGVGYLVGLKSDGTLWNIKENTQIGTDTDWDTIYGGNFHLLITKTDGSLWSYGFNNYGQLGVASNIQSTEIPLKIECSTLDTKNFSLNKNFEVYPNPTNKKIYIYNKSSIKIKSLTLFDVNGKILFKTKEKNYEININNFSKGFYFLKIESEIGQENIRIVKE